MLTSKIVNATGEKRKEGGEREKEKTLVEEELGFAHHMADRCQKERSAEKGSCLRHMAVVDFFNLFHFDIDLDRVLYLLYRFANANIPQYFKCYESYPIKSYSIVNINQDVQTWPK